ncbi:nonstructural protein [Blackfly microvirus SF02]|uniref:Nonstructural protein n=1 Tax=Blackfly microvirus SF02 TaxID=2576452 RepID=A0A4P8PKV3_9VIRU|nr:nonstructural protein [Blackfly microvirus SF02]
MKIYTINDSKASFYMQPFYARQNGEAIRTFAQAVNDTSNPNNLMARSPADYSLYEIGEFDELTGQITPVNPVSLGNGVDFKEQK